MRISPDAVRVAVLVGIGVSVVAGVAAAQPLKSNVGAFDFSKLAATSAVARTALARSSRREPGRSRRERVKLANDAPLLSESARTLAQQAFARAQRAFDRQREDAEAEVNQVQLDVERELRARLFPVVDAVAREKGLHLVLNVSSADFLWVHPDIGISEDVARRLDREPGKGPPVPKP